MAGILRLGKWQLTNKKCEVEFCGVGVKRINRFCIRHYRQHLAGEEFSPPEFKHKNKGVKCSFDGCQAECIAKALCGTHYNQQRRGLPLTPVYSSYGQRLIKHVGCQIYGCENPHYSGAYCRQHWTQKNNGKDVNAPLKGSADFFGICSIASCDKSTSHRFNICSHHRHVAVKYSMTNEAYEEFMHPNACAACGSNRKLSVHHDHRCCQSSKSCGKCVVALLCGNCNIAAGLLGDDPERLIKLAAVVRA